MRPRLPVPFRSNRALVRRVVRLALLLGALALALSGVVGADEAADYAPREILVRYREGAPASARTAAESAVRARRVLTFSLAPIHLLELESEGEVEQAVARLRTDPAVAYAEPNYRLHAALVPNDPLFPQQVALRNTGQSGGIVGADVHAIQAWDIFTGNGTVKVAILDTGVDATHPDLADNMWLNPDEARGVTGDDDDVNGYVDDVNGYNVFDGNGDVTDITGHGTQVAGAIGAVGNNGRGIAGINWSCQMVAVKVMRTPNDGSVATAIAGLQFAVQTGVRIATNAWTVNTFSQSLLDAIDAAGRGGLLFVAAAGNNGLDLDATPRYPAAYASPYVLSVAASDESDELAPFSNYGATSVDLAAPGVTVTTTQSGHLYTTASGTSMAAGLVAGTCALALGRFPFLTNLDLKELVIRSSEQRSGLAGLVLSGGRLNAASSIADPDITPPRRIVDLAVVEPGSNSVVLSWTAPGDDDSTGQAMQYELRYSTSPIDGVNFSSATRVPLGAPAVGGTIERADIGGLATSTLYYFAVRAIDESDNLAPISNVVTATTLGPPSIVVTPSRLGTALVTGATTTETFEISNPTQGTLDFSIPSPQLQGLVRENPYERSRAKGEPDGAPGGPMTESAGGPDGFGYLWSDNDALHGPDFRWIDLTSLGPPVALSGDDTATVAMPMGIEFPFYGSVFDRVSIATNGYLTFTPSPVVYDNHAFPTTSGTPNMIAPLWDDFVFGTTHRAYARRLDDRFVVSWVGVVRADGVGGPYTFQVILHSTGEIQFQYLSLGSVRNSATIGIQNQARSIGLGVVHNALYVRDSLAIRIRPVTEWLSVSPDSGRVRAGESATIEARFDAIDLPQGGLHAEIGIRSNDPARPLVTVPVHLYVIGAPDLHLSPAAIQLDTVTVGVPVTRTVTLQNRGRLWLRVRSIETSDPGLTATAGPIDVPPGGSRTVTLRYAPSSAGVLESNIVLWSNDPDGGRRLLPITATVVTPPVIAVSPESLIVDLYTNDETTRTLRVANRGGSPLRVLAQVGYVETAPPAPALDAAPPRVEPRRRGGPDEFGYTFVDSDDPDGPDFAWIDLTGTGTQINMTGDDANSGPYPIGFSFPFYGNNYSSFRISTNGFLSLTSTSSMYINLPLPNMSAPTNLIAPFWDDLSFGGVRSVYMRSDSTQLVVEYRAVPRYAETAPNTFQVILRRDGRIDFQYLSITTPEPDSCTVGIQNDSGEDGLQVAYDETYVRSGLAVRIVPPRQFLSVEPTQAVIAPGDSIDVTVHVDASGLLEGDYLGRIELASNDLVRPRVDVPVRVRVRGAPLAVVAPDTLSFGAAYVGYPRTRSLTVQNIGTARLEVGPIVVGSPAYRTSSPGLSLAPAEQATLQVTLDPSGAGDFNTTLVLTTNDPIRPQITVVLRGSALLPPAIAVSPESLFAAARVPPDSDNVVTRQLVIENRGGSELMWAASTRTIREIVTTAESDRPREKPLDVQPDKSALDPPGSPVLASSGGPDAFGYKWIDSDEPGGPPFAWIDITTTGTRVPFTRDDQISAPMALPFAFELYGVSFDSVRVCSNGWLSFTSTDSTYANVRLPNSGRRTPENLIAPFWDDFDFRRGGRVYAYGDSTRFVVSFLEAPHWVEPNATPPGVYSLQAVLYPNGEIDFQYLEVTGMINSATIGIQDATKSIGLTVAFNTTYVHNGLRVRVSRLLDWFAALPPTGTLAPGESDTIEVRFDATELEDGDYRGALEITSNDPARPLIVVPVLFRVGAAGPIAASSSDPRPIVSPEHVPQEFSFARTGPHPSRDGARFDLALPEARSVELEVYDVRGARVRRIAYGELPPGEHPIEWNGAVTNGRAGPGVYFVKLSAGAWHKTLRVALIR